jgi:hypothetical protein
VSRCNWLESRAFVGQPPVTDLHNCSALWVEAVPVKEIFQGQTVWEGTV